ncbi:solute carrier family 25 member 45 [Phymastichus coffea]|uniref:solute carrier family 25 member 45 n=1 Tax=Phymastichus coffea TaxID=108790 RepID=UPI00273C2B6A|nr:solute carrier family 25 member 45 [Phymastichus coffea]
MENLQHFLAGWGAGTFGVLVGYPMDTIKTYQQMSNIKLSTHETVSMIINKDGVRGLYKGMLFPLLGSGLLNSVYFGVYDVFLKEFQSLRGYAKVHPTNAGWMQDLFIAGSIGGAAQALITCPSELIKIRMQLGKGVPKTVLALKPAFNNVSTYQTVLDMHRRYGFGYFFIGLVPTIWRDAVNGGIYIVSYQFGRHYMYGELNINPGLFEIFVAGGLAGIVSWIPVVPFDTIKSRMQADDFDKRKYKGMISCSLELFKVASYHGFFKGFIMITARSIPVNIAIIYGYELILWLCKGIDNSNLK